LNWGFSMGKFEQSAMVAVCVVLEEIVMAEREKQSSIRRRERENGEKEGTCGPSNSNKLGPT
jgi:hypothetical protein